MGSYTHTLIRYIKLPNGDTLCAPGALRGAMTAKTSSGSHWLREQDQQSTDRCDHRSEAGGRMQGPPCGPAAIARHLARTGRLPRGMFHVSNEARGSGLKRASSDFCRWSVDWLPRRSRSTCPSSANYFWIDLGRGLFGYADCGRRTLSAFCNATLGISARDAPSSCSPPCAHSSATCSFVVTSALICSLCALCSALDTDRDSEVSSARSRRSDP